MSPSDTKSRISSSDIEAKLRGLQGDVRSRVEEKQSNILAVAGIAAFALVMMFFFLGRRSGKRRSTLVEIRRV